MVVGQQQVAVDRLKVAADGGGRRPLPVGRRRMAAIGDRGRRRLPARAGKGSARVYNVV